MSIQRLLFSLTGAVLGCLPVAGAEATPMPGPLDDGIAGNEVLVDGKIWKQVTETVGASWNDIAAVCASDGSPTSGVACAGSLGSVSLNGWFWATVADVGALFDAITDPNGPHAPSGGAILGARGDHPGVFSEVNSNWAPATVAHDFAPTFVSSTEVAVLGFSSSLRIRTTYDAGYSPILADRFAADVSDLAFTEVWTDRDLRTSDAGGWFYRTGPITVPAPGAAALLALGLLLLGRRTRNNA